MAYKRKDLEGQIFNKMTVLEFVKVKGTASIYKILCHCGNTKEMRVSPIKTGKHKSCGCDIGFKKETVYNKLPKGEATFNSYFTRYKTKAKDRGYEFKLNKEQFRSLTQRDCIYCGDKPRLITKKSSGLNGGCYANGIDRFDNNKGYTLENSVTCCTECNRIKSNNDIDTLKNKIRSMYKKMGL